MISAVSFNFDSEMIATGDKGGRVVILKRVHRSNSSHNSFSSATPSHNGNRQSEKSSASRTRRRNRSTTASASNGYGGGGRSSDDEFDEESVDRDANGDGENNSMSSDEDNSHDDDNDHESSAPEFRFWTQFQSHESEFDYLKSMEIEEKINQICWCRQAGSAHRLIATNDKTIKVWRVAEKEVKALVRMYPDMVSKAANASGPSASCSTYVNSVVNYNRTNGNTQSGQGSVLSIPQLESYGSVVTATPRRIFSDAHAYHINSISLNSDEVTLLSADDLRVHLWNLDAGGVGFNILDAKPHNMEDLTEVITSAEFHPLHCHLFGYSSSRGSVKVCDLRAGALCDSAASLRQARKFDLCNKHNYNDNHNLNNSFNNKLNSTHVPARPPSFFSEIITSISDFQFSPDGRFLLTRDYMNLRLWDLHMETQPVRVIPVHDHLRLRLCDLYENDCIFDKFQCRFSADGGSLLTGSYDSLFHAYSATTGRGSAVEASVDYVSGNSNRYQQALSLDGNMIGYGPIELLDPKKRIMTLDASATEQIAAVASGPALYVYYAQDLA